MSLNLVDHISEANTIDTETEILEYKKKDCLFFREKTLKVNTLVIFSWYWYMIHDYNIAYIMYS